MRIPRPIDPGFVGNVKPGGGTGVRLTIDPNPGRGGGTVRSGELGGVTVNRPTLRVMQGGGQRTSHKSTGLVR